MERMALVVDRGNARGRPHLHKQREYLPPVFYEYVSCKPFFSRFVVSSDV